MNRRTAPQLYLEVRSIIRGSDGRLCWNLAGREAREAVDFVVVMRRFDQRDLLDNMAQRDEMQIRRDWLEYQNLVERLEFKPATERKRDRPEKPAPAPMNPFMP